MKITLELYPRWLRFWHWLNALLFLTLLFTGYRLHFGGEGEAILDFATARQLHNLAGVTFTANLLLFFLGQMISGGWVHYRPCLNGLLSDLLRQAHYYGLGIFRGEAHPFPATKYRKFNPLQQVTYLGVMLGLVPLVVVSGWLFLFPAFLPDLIWGVTSLVPVALFHYLGGLFLTLFMVGHIYLATAGESLTGEFRKMIQGHVIQE